MTDCFVVPFGLGFAGRGGLSRPSSPLSPRPGGVRLVTRPGARTLFIRRLSLIFFQRPPARATSYLALSERHMVSCVQLHLIKGAEAGGGGGDVVDSGGEGGLEGTLARAIILCVCTVSASMEVRFGLPESPVVRLLPCR